jgi:hypothetical protein
MKGREIVNKPFIQSYWVREGLLCAGHYPGALDEQEHETKLRGLIDCGIRRVINLIPAHETGANGLPFVAYDSTLERLAAERGQSVECIRLGYPDGTTPSRALMKRILDQIDASLEAHEPVYIHCWGGHGRTSTVIGCYLIRHGASPQKAIDQILAWRRPLPKNHFPYEARQEEFVRSWQAGE